MEARLRTAHNQLQTMIDAMPSALVGLAPDGTITHWNTAAGLMFGLEAAEALGRPLTDIRALFPEPAGLIEECLKNRRPTASRRFNRVTEGSTSHYELLVYPLDSGDETGAVIRVDDATERVRLQEIMVQTEKMMSVGGLAAGMAHEINNPLGGVVLGAENILRRLSPDLEPNRRAALAQGTDMTVITGYLEQRKVVPLVEGVLESGLRAARIVADMLAFSRSGHSEFTPTLLNELLDRTVALAANDYDLKKQYDFRHIEIVREYDPGLGPVVCQVNKIEQVILNLLKNAAQALAGRPRPAGEPPRITLRTGVEGDLARVEVGDNGPGMDETTRRRVFEPFFTTKPVGVGTGLGLSISYFIITDNHRGRLSVDSQPGEGSRFIIHLPFSGPGSRRAGKGSDPPPGEDE
jgi:PAS domain S-box-containing protein